MPVDLKLFLCNMVFDPVESHIYGFGSLMFDLFVGEAVGGSVVDLDGGWWLGSSHFVECIA